MDEKAGYHSMWIRILLHVIEKVYWPLVHSSGARLDGFLAKLFIAVLAALLALLFLLMRKAW